MDTLSLYHSAVNLEWIVCSMVQSVVVETALLAQKSLLSLLFMMRSQPDDIYMVPELTATDKRFPFFELNRLEKPTSECKDADETDDDDSDAGDVEGDDDQDDDGDSAGEEGSDDDEDDSGVEANGDGESDEDDDDEDTDDDDDDEDDDDEEEDDEKDEEEEEETQPPSKKKK